jgi:hypothetical protein
MHFLEKCLKFMGGLFLLLSYYRRLNFNKLVKGKRVAIVGAANSAYQTNKGEFIDSFDYVIRINKAPFVLANGKSKVDIGQKADLLFHSFFENEQFGGGPLNFGLYDQLGVQYVINPIPTFFGSRNTLNFYKKYLVRRNVYTLSRKQYKSIVEGIQNYRPTIGLCALVAALESDFSELYITGFTFFKTNYAHGYRDSLEEVKQVRSTMNEMKIHNPDLEFNLFTKLLQKHHGKNIKMDSVLDEIIKTHPGMN